MSHLFSTLYSVNIFFVAKVLNFLQTRGQRGQKGFIKLIQAVVLTNSCVTTWSTWSTLFLNSFLTCIARACVREVKIFVKKYEITLYRRRKYD